MNKSLVAAASVSGIGVSGMVGYGISTWFSNSKKISFRSRINKQERIILNDTHTNVWSQLLTEYKNRANAKNLITGIGQESPTEQEFKIWCSKMHDSKTGSKSEFDSYVSWCTRENLATKLKGNSKNWNNSTENSDWASAKSSYNASSDTTIQIPADSGSGVVAQNSVTEEQLKNYCQKTSSMPFINDTDADYKRSTRWCVTN